MTSQQRQWADRVLHATVIALGILALIQIVGCASAVGPLQVQQRVEEVQNAAIAAQQNGGLPTDTARTIVQFTAAASGVLKDLPAGWQATVASSWAQVKALVPATAVEQNPALRAAWSALDVVIAQVTEGGQ